MLATLHQYRVATCIHKTSQSFSIKHTKYTITMLYIPSNNYTMIIIYVLYCVQYVLQIMDLYCGNSGYCMFGIY